MLQRAATNACSWWWASHVRTKQSKWLESSLQGKPYYSTFWQSEHDLYILIHLLDFPDRKEITKIIVKWLSDANQRNMQIACISFHINCQSEVSPSNYVE